MQMEVGLRQAADISVDVGHRSNLVSPIRTAVIHSPTVLWFAGWSAGARPRQNDDSTGGGGGEPVGVEDHNRETAVPPDGSTDVGEEPLEAAVKGIAAGIAGKAKQVVGELLEDDELERAGKAQQEQAEARRASGRD
jgi:uncharacterized protein YjbJ (UPF0337 family)